MKFPSPFTNIAEQVGKKVVVNIVMLGALSAFSRIISKVDPRPYILVQPYDFWIS